MKEVEWGISCGSADGDFVRKERMRDMVWPVFDLAIASLDDAFSDGKMTLFYHAIGLGIVRRDFNVGYVLAVHQD